MHLPNNSEVYKKIFKKKKRENKDVFYVHGALISLIMYAIFIIYVPHVFYVRKIIKWYVFLHNINYAFTN